MLADRNKTAYMRKHIKALSAKMYNVALFCTFVEAIRVFNNKHVKSYLFSSPLCTSVLPVSNLILVQPKSWQIRKNHHRFLLKKTCLPTNLLIKSKWTEKRINVRKAEWFTSKYKNMLI